MTMKYFFILLFSITLTLNSLSQEISNIQTIYKQVVNTIKNYEIIPEIEKKGVNHFYYSTKSMGITYKYPILEISFYFEIDKNVWTSENLSGTYRLICPINSTVFKAESSIGDNGWLCIQNPNGIELVYKGKRKLIENYYFYGTKLTMKKLCSELSDLQEVIKTTHYKGNLGISTNNSKTYNPSNNSSSFTYYNTEGFAIKKTYKLEENTVFTDMLKGITTEGIKLIAAYQCPQNIESDNPEHINLINIVVYEISAPATEVLKAYTEGLSRNKFKYTNRSWNGLTGVEYTFKSDMGGVMLPTKAFYGFKGNKFYLIQLASLTDYLNKYNNLLNSIKIL